MTPVMLTGDCDTSMKKDHNPRSPAAYPNLDLAKFICALLVIIIHTSPVENISKLAHFYLENVIARVAVPLFFAMSGFLFFGKLDYADGRIARTRENFSRLLRTIRKNTILYVVWSVIYLAIILPEWYAVGWWGWTAVKDWFHSFLFIGSYYHLWYLLSLILAVPALYVLLRVVPVSRIWIVVSGLWVLECLVYSYAWIGIDQIPLVAFISSKMPIIFDGLLRALPLVCIGAILSQRQIGAPKVTACVGTFLLCAAEASGLYFFSPNESFYSYLVFTPIMTWFALSGLIAGKQVPLRKQQQLCLRDMSLSIYCVHPMVCWLCKQLSIPSGIPFWLTVTAISVTAAYAWTNRKRILLNREHSPNTQKS